jgi:cytochrome c biogenesis protein ResB
MPPLEPKRYVSEVTIFTEDGKSIPATIEVNKPIKVNGWKIYQLSYDETMGKWSRKSTFELVRDPWLPVVYTGITMMLLGAVYLFAFAKIGKKNI